jgi:hypothetical protein
MGLKAQVAFGEKRSNEIKETEEHLAHHLSEF